MRRLVICCDGTWNSPTNKDGTRPAPTNVRKFWASVARTGPADNGESVEQICFYRTGVGVSGGRLARLIGGLTGRGLEQDVQSAFKWLCDTYQSGDQLYLVGFSRGAYCVRSLAGLIEKHGIFKFRDSPLSDRRRWQVVKYAEAQLRHRRHSIGVQVVRDYNQYQHAIDQRVIRFLGVWDTVGSLGIPDDYALFSSFTWNLGRHQFHDTKLGKIVETARHAMALDEMRVDFIPTLWDPPGHSEITRDIQQLWFPGVHGDLGGSYSDRGLGDCALSWMIDEAAATGLEFDQSALDHLKPDPRAALHDSVMGIFRHRQTRPRAIPNLDATHWTDVAAEHPGRTHPSEAAKQRILTPGIAEPHYRMTRRLRLGESAVIQCDARRHWNESGIYMGAGESYRIEAKGEWLDSSIRAGSTGFSRGHWLSKALHAISFPFELLREAYRRITQNPYAENLLIRPTRRHIKAPWFGLMGTIANGQGTLVGRVRRAPHESFYLGDTRVIEVTRPGYFFTYANDAWGYYHNNSGQLTLTVTKVKEASA